MSELGEKMRVLIISLLGAFVAVWLMHSYNAVAATPPADPLVYARVLHKMNPAITLHKVAVMPTKDVPVDLVTLMQTKGMPVTDYVVVVAASVCRPEGTIYFMYITPILENASIGTEGVAVELGYDDTVKCPVRVGA
jgi:hypothetical protein